MPIYEYDCSHCKETFEEIKNQPPEQALCPKCHATADRKVSAFSSAGGCDAPSNSGFG